MRRPLSRRRLRNRCRGKLCSQPQHLFLFGGAVSPGSSPATVLPSAMTMMRSARASTSGRSDETTTISATPLSRETALRQAVDFGARADIDAARRLVDDAAGAWFNGQPFGQQYLLLVAARQIADDLIAPLWRHYLQSASNKRSWRAASALRCENRAGRSTGLRRSLLPRCCSHERPCRGTGRQALRSSGTIPMPAAGCRPTARVGFIGLAAAS